eukprot:7433917-Pyramimonas_sp.AAC.1
MLDEYDNDDSLIEVANDDWHWASVTFAAAQRCLHNRRALPGPEQSSEDNPWRARELAREDIQINIK